MIKIIDFKVEHLKQMDAREYEAGFIDKLLVLGDLSVESKTAMLGDEVLCCWGISFDDYFWQVPSKLLKDNVLAYARRAYKVTQKMLEDRVNAYTVCPIDCIDDRHMRFLGFKPSNDPFEYEGKSYLRYEVKSDTATGHC